MTYCIMLIWIIRKHGSIAWFSDFEIKGPAICTSKKFVYLVKIAVIANVLQVRMVCRDLTNFGRSRLFTFPYFPCDRNVYRWVERARLPSWSLEASETGKSTKCPLPTGILYYPLFCFGNQETKMAACRTQRSTSTISRENEGLWAVICPG